MADRLSLPPDIWSLGMGVWRWVSGALRPVAGELGLWPDGVGPRIAPYDDGFFTHSPLRRMTLCVPGWNDPNPNRDRPPFKVQDGVAF
jgi:hypothetical protein